MTKPKAKTLTDALSANDPDTVRRQAIDSRLAAMLEVGPQEWDYEPDFAKSADLSLQVVQAYREHYRKHWVIAPRTGERRAGKCLWFADPKVAQQFRDKVGVKQP